MEKLFHHAGEGVGAFQEMTSDLCGLQIIMAPLVMLAAEAEIGHQVNLSAILVVQLSLYVFVMSLSHSESFALPFPPSY